MTEVKAVWMKKEAEGLGEEVDMDGLETSLVFRVKGRVQEMGGSMA